MFIRAFIEKPEKTFYDGEDDDENIFYLIRQSLITNISWVIISILMILAPFIAAPVLAPQNLFPDAFTAARFSFILLIFWYMITISYIFLNFVNWFYNVYIITDKKIVDFDYYGVIYKRISEAPLANVEDVTSSTSGAIGTIFNVGNVFIQTAAENTEFEFTMIDHPEDIRDIISDMVTEVHTTGHTTGHKPHGDKSAKPIKKSKKETK